MKDILILGIGNYLMGDEGIGVHVAQQMESMNTPAYIQIMDGGTGGFYLMSYLENYPNVIIVDATLDDHPVGTIRKIKPQFSKDFPQLMSTHDIGMKDMIAALQLTNKMPNIHLFVVSIASIQQQGIHLTPAIQAIVPSLIDQVIAEAIEINKHKCTNSH